MPRIYNYKSTASEVYWKAQLKKIKKVLTKKDKKLLKSFKYENQCNESMLRIQTYALEKNLHITCLTDLAGDCMFESIEKTGFCKDKQVFRRSVALLLFLFGNCNVIETSNVSLKDTFELFNDVEFVFCHDTKKLYKYTYYTMCSDMYTDGSWSRLPTEIVLTVISIFFKVRINIYHDNGHIDMICSPELDQILDVIDPEFNINIALIGENHYVPLSHIPDKDTQPNECPKYTIQMDKFHKWARDKADMIGLYVVDAVDDTNELNNTNKSNESAKNDICMAPITFLQESPKRKSKNVIEPHGRQQYQA